MNNIIIGLAGLIFILVLVIGYLSITNAHKDTEIATLKADKATYENANTELKASIEKYDAAMKVMRDQAAIRAKQVQKELDAARLKAKRFEVIAANISKLKPATKNDCQNAQVLLKNYLRGNK